MNRTEISLLDIFQSVLHHLVLIFLATVVTGVAAFVVSSFFIPKSYVSTVAMFTYSSSTQDGNITYNEQYSNTYLANNFADVLKRDAVLSVLSEELKEQGLDYSVSSLKSAITTSLNDRTAVFTVSVRVRNPNHAYIIAHTLETVAPEKIPEITGYGKISILDYAKVPTGPASPNVMRNTILGLLVGLFLSVAYAIIRDLTDTTIWTEEDLTKRFDIPVLGVVPQLSNSDKKKEQ